MALLVVAAKSREIYLVKARGFPRGRRRRSVATVIRAYPEGFGELARVVLWLELLGYHCSVYRLKVR